MGLGVWISEVHVKAVEQQKLHKHKAVDTAAWPSNFQGKMQTKSHLPAGALPMSMPRRIIELVLAVSFLFAPSVWAQDRTGTPEQAAAIAAQNKRDFDEGQLTPDIVARLLSPDLDERNKGYTPKGRWVNIAQEDLDNCFKQAGVPGTAPPAQTKSAAGQAWQGTDRYLDVRWVYGRNQHELSSTATERDLKLLAQHINNPAHAQRQWVIEGHANADGSPDAVNRDVSCRRAAYVRDQLRQRYGVDTRRVQAVGYGASQPAVEPAKDGKNRRVRIRLLAAQ